MSKKQESKGLPTGLIRTIAILGIIFLGYQGMKIAKISHNLDGQLEDVQKEIAAEHQKLENLKIEYENIESLGTVESIAREKLGLVKGDEIVFREKH